MITSQNQFNRRNALKLGLSAMIAMALRSSGQTPPSLLLPERGGPSGTASLDSSDISLKGGLGDVYDRAVARLAMPPYTVEWLRSDVSFEQKRAFTNFSGDVSGRFLEIASLTSNPGLKSPTLAGMIDSVPNYQRADGHFGAEVNWSNPSEVMTQGTPILWGNARLLIGLVTAYEQFHDPKILDAAKKLGDFYVTTAPIFCNADNQRTYQNSKGYASGFQTCYFPAIESLVRLYWLTKDDRYLKLSEQMAALFYQWDHLPLPHTHGNLCAQFGLVLLYEATGDVSYLNHVEARWDEITEGGYVCPTGAVGEFFTTNSRRDEGCAEADWLRLTLRLWACTGKIRYLNMADREIHNEYLANQFPDGGFGHRLLESDKTGVCGLHRHDQEATWCCVFHGPLGLVTLKSYLAVGANDGIYLNFPVDFTQTVVASGQPWKVTAITQTKKDALSLSLSIQPTAASGNNTTRLMIRLPEWATSIQASDAEGNNVVLSPVTDHLLGTGPLPGGRPLQLPTRSKFMSKIAT